MKSEAPVMAMQLRGSPVVICLLLCAASVHANHLVHESTATAFLVNQQDAKDGLDDDKMADLTGSIEGLFDDNSEAPAKDAKKVATAAPAAKAKPNPPAKVVQAAVKAAAKIPAKVVANVAKPKAVPVAAKVVKAKAVAAVAKPVQEKAEKKPVPTKQATAKKVSPAPVAAKVVAKAPQPKVAKVASKPAHAEVAKLAAKPSQPKVVAAKPLKPKAALVAAKPVTKAASKRVETKVAKAAAAKPTPPKVAKKVATPEKPKVVKMAAKATQPKVVAAKSAKPVAKVAAKPVAKVAAKPVAKVALVAVKPVAKVAAKTAQPKVAEAAAKPVQPKVAKVVAKPTQPKVTKMAAKPVEPKVVKMAAKPAQPKVVTKVAAKTVQPKVAAAAAKPSQPKATKVVAKAAQPEVVKMAAKTTQPKATKAVAKPAQPEVIKMAAKTTQPKATKAVAKPAQSKVAEVAKVAKVVAKPAQPKATKVAAKPAQPKVVKMVAKTAQPEVATMVAKPPQPKATQAKPSQPKAAKVITKPSQPEVVKAVSKKAKVEAKPTAKVAPAPVAKVVKVEKSMKKPEQLKAIPPLAKVQVAAKPLSKLAVAKVLSNNSDVHVAVTNTSKSAPANKTKVIEEAVVSLPMASFALDIAGPDANKTKVAEHKFPGNASQKAAWDKKEEALEHEVQRLKMRLAKVNATPAKLAAKVPPAATGTFNSNVGVKTEQKDKKAVPMNKSTEPTRTAPMEPIRKEKIPKAAWPTMQSVAAPVALHHVNSPVVPPQKEAIEAQQGKKTVAMGSTFTGTPSKKVESIMALDAEVVHDAVMTDVVQEDAPETLSWWQQGQDWVSSIGDFIGRKMGLQSAAAVPKKAHKSHHAAASLLDMTQRGLKQDMERTEQATKDEGEHIVALGSVWGQMEEEDKTQEQQVKSEDESERQRASFREAPHTPSKAELQGRHGHDMSSFWGSLEQLDSDLQKAESTENLGEYQRLTGVQNWLVTKASNQLKETGLHMERDETLKHNDQAFLSKTIHDPWESLEKKDKAVETQIHDSPDLQMLQLKHSSHPYK